MQPQQDQNYWQPEVNEATGTITPAETPLPDTTAVSTDAADVLEWQASEYVHHEKSVEWFLALLAVASLLLLLDIFLIRSWTFGVLIVVMALAAIVVARRPPRILNYLLSAEGISIDEKLFRFHDFRAFGVVQEGAFYSIRLIPSKRFMPMVSVYFPPELGEQIVDLFGSVLPMEQIKLDAIDRFVEKIRF